MPGEGLVQYTGSWRPAAAYRAYSYLLVSIGDASRAAREPGRSLVYFSGTDVNTSGAPAFPIARPPATAGFSGTPTGTCRQPGLPRQRRRRRRQPRLPAGLGRATCSRSSAATTTTACSSTTCSQTSEPLAGTEAAKYPTQTGLGRSRSCRSSGRGQRPPRPRLLRPGQRLRLRRRKPASDDGSNTLRWWRQLAPLRQRPAQRVLPGDLERRGRGAQHRERPGTRTGPAGSGWPRTAQSLGKDFFGLSYGRPATCAR